jgi:hypothetical protein
MVDFEIKAVVYRGDKCNKIGALLKDKSIP